MHKYIFSFKFLDHDATLPCFATLLTINFRIGYELYFGAISGVVKLHCIQSFKKDFLKNVVVVVVVLQLSMKKLSNF